MKRCVALAVAAHLAGAASSAAGDHHLVPLSAAHVRLRQHAVERNAHLTVVRSWLASPHVVSAAGRIGLDADVLSIRAAALTDAELRDLAERTAALETNPTAGGMLKVFVILLVIAAVWLLLVWAWCESDEGCNIV